MTIWVGATTPAPSRSRSSSNPRIDSDLPGIDAIEPGVTTLDLDAVARDSIKSAGATPSFLGYHGFPAVICVSVNEEIQRAITAHIEARRSDPDFRQRLKASIERNREILERLP